MLRLRITSVRQEGGKWIADGRVSAGGKSAPVKIDVDTRGAKPSLHWTARSGATCDLSLVDDTHIVGTTMMTTTQAQSGDRERAVRLEKEE